MNHLLLVIFISFVFISCSPTTTPPQQHTGSIPTVTTIFANSITQTTAKSGGTIDSDGGDSITARGICWSISSNPTLANSTTNDGKGSGTFFSSLTGLTLNTLYFIRAYATNKNGTAYGNQVNFTTVNKTGLTVAGSSTGVSGSTANLLIFPAGVFVDSFGNIYISDQNNNRVQKWAPGATSGTTVAGGNGPGSNSNQTSAPTGIFVDKIGNIYVANGSSNKVQKWAPGASYGITVAGTEGYLLNKGYSSSQLNNPWGIFVDVNGNIYIADSQNNRIQKWAPGATKGITVAGDSSCAPGGGDNQLNFPQGVFVDTIGNIYVSDTKNNRIQKWAPGAKSGITVAGGSWGNTSTQLGSPASIFVDNIGNMYIADWDFGRIQKWAPGATSGTTVAGGNGLGVNANQLYSPVSVFVDKSANIYIADFENNRVQKW